MSQVTNKLIDNSAGIDLDTSLPSPDALADKNESFHDIDLSSCAETALIKQQISTKESARAPAAPLDLTEVDYRNTEVLSLKAHVFDKNSSLEFEHAGIENSASEILENSQGGESTVNEILLNPNNNRTPLGRVLTWMAAGLKLLEKKLIELLERYMPRIGGKSKTIEVALPQMQNLQKQSVETNPKRKSKKVKAAGLTVRFSQD